MSNMESFDHLAQIEDAAANYLQKWVYDYIRSGATARQTLSENKAAFKRLRLRPRLLRDVTNPDTSSTVLGTKIALPIGISPSAFHCLAHPDGEVAMVKAAGSRGAIYILASLSNTSIEDIAIAGPDTIKWMQVFFLTDRSFTADLVRRAEKCGFKAIVVTVDNPVLGTVWAGYDIKTNLLSSPLRCANYEKYFNQINDKDKRHQAIRARELEDQPTATWDDIKWLTGITKLPVVIKGILTGEDAQLAAESGCAAIYVSNHGGRHLDGTAATIEVLPEIVRAVKDKNVDVYLDGGVSEGSDIFKALALGAKMVFTGRQPLYGLAVGGQQGIERVFDILKNDFEKTLCLTGCKNLKDISREMVTHHSYYSKF